MSPLAPILPAGVKGWGAAGELDLRAIERLAQKKTGTSLKICGRDERSDLDDVEWNPLGSRATDQRRRLFPAS